MKRTLLAVMLLCACASPTLAQEDVDPALVEQLVNVLTPPAQLGADHLGIDSFAKAATPPPPAEVTAMIEEARAPSVNLTINFAFGSFDLTPASEVSLNALAMAMKHPALAGHAFLVAGHTDAKGSDAYNDLLSFNRANAVVRYLTYVGHIDPRRLAPYAYGEHQLKDPADPEGAINRRVQFVTIDAAAASN